MKSATIQLKRETDLFGVARGLKVFIDGNCEGKIKANETSEFPVSAGRHRIYVKMDWCTSEPFWVDLKQEEKILFKVRIPAMESEWGPFKMLYDLVANASCFFELKRFY